jgi:hypothetical protein
MGANISDALLIKTRTIEADLERIANAYRTRHDARWMFARAHHLITREINRTIELPRTFHDPNALLRFNMAFASAFLAAVRDMPSTPWREAFAQCMAGQVYSDVMNERDGYSRGVPMLSKSDDATAVQSCAIAMANAHINTDIVHALRTVGCINVHDYGNVLLFVERAARTTIMELNGPPVGEMLNWLKQMLLPLDKIWRNAAYRGVCGVDVPPVEAAFIASVGRRMSRAATWSP